jgi:hypothetical protein
MECCQQTARLAFIASGKQVNSKQILIAIHGFIDAVLFYALFFR